LLRAFEGGGDHVGDVRPTGAEVVAAQLGNFGAQIGEVVASEPAVKKRIGVVHLTGSQEVYQGTGHKSQCLRIGSRTHVDVGDLPPRGPQFPATSETVSTSGACGCSRAATVVKISPSAAICSGVRTSTRWRRTEATWPGAAATRVS